MVAADPPLDAWTIPVQGGQGTVAGHHNTQHNTFHATPSRAPYEVPPPRRTHNLPPRSAVFVGRDLDHLDRLLGQSATGVVVGQVAVHGLGGIGKTELVIHYGHAVSTRYPLVWWITADSPDNIAQGLVRLANRLQSTATIVHAQEWAIDWLQTHPGWLLILDNVEEIADIRPLLGQLTGCGNVLVTTRRDPTAGGWAPLGLAPLRLEPLGRPASVELLVRLTGNDDREGAGALAADLGDLPLALEQAAAYIGRHHGMDYHSYRDALKTQFDKVSRHGGRGGNTNRTVSQVWQITMTTITDESPLAHTVLDVLAWLAPDQLPQDVLFPLAEDPDDVLDAVALLADHNMIKWQSRMVSVHRLVQAVTRSTHAEPTREAGPASEAVRLLDDAIPAGSPMTDIASWPRWSSLLTHIDALYLAIPADHEDNRMLHLATRAALYRLGHGQLTPAFTLIEHVLADCRRLRGDDHPNTLTARHNLAFANHLTGRMPEATALYEQVLADRGRVLGKHHPDTLLTRNNLAHAYQDAGRVPEATALYEQVLADRRRVLGPKHPDTLLTRNNLAYAFLRAGRIAESITQFEHILTDYREVLGEDHLYTLATRHNLASAHRMAGRVDEAISQYEEILTDSRRVLGDDHPDTLSTRYGLAVAYQAAGYPADAVTLYEQLLTDRRRVLGEDHPDTRATAEALRAARAALD